MKRVLFLVVLATSLAIVFSQGKPCCKNKAGKGNVACKYNQANIDQNKEGISEGVDSQVQNAGVQCPHSAQSTSVDKQNCPNHASAPWWKFWGKKKGCCNTNS
ncbi:MAG: hypothetical protein H8E85_01010 [Candidatus Marinimicrobia bacterium]|nr:hypothetical protein [Candidatus Neomarinimicrobiota bacterium]